MCILKTFKTLHFQKHYIHLVYFFSRNFTENSTKFQFKMAITITIWINEKIWSVMVGTWVVRPTINFSIENICHVISQCDVKIHNNSKLWYNKVSLQVCIWYLAPSLRFTVVQNQSFIWPKAAIEIFYQLIRSRSITLVHIQELQKNQ